MAKRPQLNFDVDEELKRSFLSLTRANGDSVKDVLTDAVMAYLEGNGKGPRDPRWRDNNQNCPQHELLERVLRSDPWAADWITGTLRMFAELLALRRKDGNG